MSSEIESAILKTLSYSDVFDYPLKYEEIGKWLIKCKVQSAKCKIIIKNLKRKKIIAEKDGYYCLRGRESIFAKRKKREKLSEEKMKIAGQIAKFLRIIPTVKLIGLTGGLAVNNADADDDIDLFIITAAGFLWTTRFFTTLLVDLSGQRRRPGDGEVKDKICLNMFMDENYLSLSEKNRDLFSAHEVLQMKPLWDRENTYVKFLQANEWVKKFLPKAFGSIVKQFSHLTIENKDRVLFNGLEYVLKNFQLWYMNKRRTKERISEGVLSFHPQDAKRWVLAKYKKRVRKLFSEKTP